MSKIPSIIRSSDSNIGPKQDTLSKTKIQSTSVISNQKFSKKRTSLTTNSEETLEGINIAKLRSLPTGYCVNIQIEGSKIMDQVVHINSISMNYTNLITLNEMRLRPISGLHNLLKRNFSANQTYSNVLKDTDLIERIGNVKSLKRLDLSFNYLNQFPRRLCDLDQLEILNLTGNSLNENEFPLETEQLHRLIELTLDNNNLKSIPKCISKLKNLQRLSIRKNLMNHLNLIHHLKNLKFLILDSNLLTHIEENIRMLEKLEVLHLSNNLIKQLDTSGMHYLTQLDISFNKLNTVAIDVFLLPHLEILNLSNNKISMLPILPTTYFRTMPIFLLDLSSNSLIRFYEYLIVICDRLDLSSNNIKTIPSKAIQKLNYKQLNTKTLKIGKNPLIDPPLEYCEHGFKVLKEYFDEKLNEIQLNKGFKLIILGDKNSGKTTLAYALEDVNSQSNLIEQFNISNDLKKNALPKTESKFVEIHDFFLETEPIDSHTDSALNKKLTSSENIMHDSSLSSTPTPGINSEADSSFNSFFLENHRLTSSKTRLNAFANNNFIYNYDKITSNSKKIRMPISVYDFNSSIDKFGHLINMFLDKSALIIICIDSVSILKQENNLEKNFEWEVYLKQLLDLIILKMSKNNFFYLLPVMTKKDQLRELEDYEFVSARVTSCIQAHIHFRLNDIKAELKSIELLPSISASQSDRLKHLAQLQANLKPEIYATGQLINSITLDGIKELSDSILKIVTSNRKYFPDVYNKVPTFWSEIEHFALNVLSETPKTKYQNEVLNVSQNSTEAHLSILYLDYSSYKKKIIEKYGMGHLVDSITKYLSSSGKIVWFHENEKLRKIVFLRPNILFDMFFVLFRTNFEENFTDTHTQTLRMKLIKNSIDMSEENMKKLKNDFIDRGLMSMDLLKILWYPILVTDSSDIVREAFLLFSRYFHIGYPDLPKEKLKLLFNAFEINKENVDTFRTCEKSMLDMSQLQFTSTKFTNTIIPFYLPNIQNITDINKLRNDLINKSKNAVTVALKIKLKKEKTRLLIKLKHKYVFPWGLMPGIFEKFTTNCILYSELDFKLHYRNCVLAYNETNTIG